MSGLKATAALSLDQNRLVAVSGSDSNGRIRVKTWISVQAPTGLDMRDAAKVGEWIKAEFEKAGMSGAKLAVAVPRGDVVLKRLRLPKGEGSKAVELAGMVRLQMARQLTMAIEGTAIDYLTIESGTDTGTNGAGTVDVLAGALPAERMQWYRDLVEAAGCSMARVGLKASGAAALMAGISHKRNGPVLGVTLGWGSIEFIVVRDGQLVFARAADVGLDSVKEGEGALGAKIAVEAKRTWMSYRVGDEAAAVEAVVVPGSGALAREAGEACGKALEMPWELAEIPGSVEFPKEMGEADRLVAAPLIGLLAEEVLAKRSLDFANPRKAPDLAAARRQRVLAAALGLIVVGGGGYVYSGMEVASAESRLTAAKQRSTVLRTDYNEYLKDHARLSHIQKWTGAGFDWLAHASWLSEQMPDPRQAQLDQLAGGAGLQIELTPKDGRYDVDGWTIRQVAKFSIQGKARQREVANELRDRLVTSPVYQVETKGADLADRFAMELTTAASTPEAAQPALKSAKPAGTAPKKDAKAEKGGGK